jgi:hypothetical protein
MDARSPVDGKPFSIRSNSITFNGVKILLINLLAAIRQPSVNSDCLLLFMYATVHEHYYEPDSTTNRWSNPKIRSRNVNQGIGCQIRWVSTVPVFPRGPTVRSLVAAVHARRSECTTAVRAIVLSGTHPSSVVVTLSNHRVRLDVILDRHLIDCS